jgi:hypothetical protein
VPGGQ